MKHRRVSIGAVLVLGALVSAAPALAQEGGMVRQGNWVFKVGAGVGAEPDYEGSQDYQPIPIPFAMVRRGQLYASLYGTTLKANVVPNEIVQFGPVIRYRFGRDDVDNDAVDRLEKVDDALELGGFVGLSYRNWSLSVEGAQDVLDGHGGYLVRVDAGHKIVIDEAMSLSLGGHATYASSDYMDSFFTIDARNAARSGLPRFSADDGFKDWGFGATFDYLLTENWSLSALFRYTRLVSDAADSPVTDDEGSPNQFFGGVLAAYTFSY